MLLKIFKNTFFPIIIGIVLVLIACGNHKKIEVGSEKPEDGRLMTDDGSRMTEVPELKTAIVVGANQTEDYLKILQGKRVGIIANQTSVIFKNSITRSQEPRLYTHLVDSLIALGIDVRTIFTPEHGFRGTADAGEHIKDGLDKRTGLPIISLYGNNKKPKLEQLKETKKYAQDIESGVSIIEVMLFDLQDVGARFYTYISTLHYMMEACAEANIPLVILDRPNPNGHYVDGPILEKEHKSFVGMHPIPVVHGMTIGEYAQMVNGEKWLKNGIKCEITVIPIKNYTHQTNYSLPIKPSPNLPNDKAINLYPSLCFFEGTNVSVGRGTSNQFQIYGSPQLPKDQFKFHFTPEPNEGAKSPPYNGKVCYGNDLRKAPGLNQLNLKHLIDAYKQTTDKTQFFNNFFIKLAGTESLQQQIEQGLSESEIRATWQNGLDDFKVVREKYLLYK